MPKVAERADLSVVESDIVPRVNQLCLATTNAGVRVTALSALAALAPRLPKGHALTCISTVQKVCFVIARLMYPCMWLSTGLRC